MAANISTRTPSARQSPQNPPRGSSAAAIFLTGAGVLVIAASAVLLSYNGIYQIALQGNVNPRYAHLYPATFTLLLLMTFWTSYLLRMAPRSRRLWIDALILGLILLAAGASALQALNDRLLPSVAVVITAAAPWVALLIAFRIFLWVLMYLRGEETGVVRSTPTQARSARATSTRRDRRPSAAADGTTDTTPTATSPHEEHQRQDEPTRAEAASSADAFPLWPREEAETPTKPEETSVRVLEHAELERLRSVRDEQLSVQSRGEESHEDTLKPAEDEETAETIGTSQDVDTRQSADPVATTAGAEEPVLPKRTPSSEGNPIKKAAEGASTASGTDEPSDPSSAATQTTGPDEESFNDDLPLGDPTSDEADFDDMVPSDENTDGNVAPTVKDDSSPQDETPEAAEPIEKRPMTLKPRRGPLPNFPEDPPSRRVRSEPTPPEE